jgi:lipoprotein Spr
VKKLLFILSLFIGTISYAQEIHLSSILVQKTDRICEAGLDIDSCAYIPLYKSLYHWLGTPYKYAGHSKKGVDCSAFAKAVIMEAFEYNLKGSSRDIYKKCLTVAKEELFEGDLVFFKINKSQISHIGVYLQNGYFVHASVSRGVMINHLSESYYKKYFYSGGRIAKS